MSNRRLASFKGPSSPSPSPVQQAKSSPRSPKVAVVDTVHRKCRAILLSLQSIAETWDDLVLIDGQKALKRLIDARTLLDNQLTATPSPRMYLMKPSLAAMDSAIADIDATILKLRLQLRKMTSAIDNLENLFFETVKQRGHASVCTEPLWTTWTLEQFVIRLPSILIPYHRSLASLTIAADSIRSHDTTFEQSKQALRIWTSQEDLDEQGWSDKWEPLCSVEVDQWD